MKAFTTDGPFTKLLKVCTCKQLELFANFHGFN